MLGAPLDQAGPARRMAVAGALVDLVAATRMEDSMGLAAETLHHGRAGHLIRTSKALTGLGAAATALFGARSRAVSAVAGAALLAGSACTRFGIFEAGQASARDPKYTVVPQRRRLEQAGRPVPDG
jgi:hypothetical protein